MSRWRWRMLGLVMASAVLLPSSVSAATAQTVTVVSGHALVGGSPRFVSLSCALDRPLAASSAKVSYGASAYPGHTGVAARLVPPRDAANAYGVVATIPVSGLSSLTIQAGGEHGMVIPVVQYATSGGAIMLGGSSVSNSGYAWSSFSGLGQTLNWTRYANGTATFLGAATLASTAAKYPATSSASAGFVFGCDSADHVFDVDDLTVGSGSGARSYHFEAAPVATRVSLSSPHRVRVGKRVVLRGRLAPAAAGIPVGVYQVRHGKRKLIRTVRTDRAGRFSMRTSFKHRGKFRWAAAVRPPQRWVTGSSRTATVTVLPKPKPKPKPKPTPVQPPAVHTPPSAGSGSGSTSQPTPPPPSGCSGPICSG